MTISHRLKRFAYPGYYRSAGLKHRIRRLLTPPGWFVLIGLAICGAVGADTTQAMAYQTTAILGAAVVVAAFWHFGKQPALTVQRELPRYASAGTPFSYRVRLANQSSRDWSGLSLIDEAGDPRPSLAQFLGIPEPGEQKRNAFDRSFGFYRWVWLMEKNRVAQAIEFEIPQLRPLGEAELTVQILPLRRGLLRFERAEIARRDPFGLVRRITPVQNRQTVTVLPKRYVIPKIPLPGTLEYQKGGVALASSVGESEEFVSLRDYRRGDPLRHIHWKSSARTGDLVVKEFQDEFFARHALVLDTFHGEQASDVFEEAVSVAASLVCTVQNQDSLLDLLFVGTEAYCFTSGRGVGQPEQLLEVLAAVQASPEKSFSDLDRLVSGHLQKVSGVICVLLAWDEQRRDFVRKIRGFGVPVLVLVVTAPGPVILANRLGDQHPEPVHFLQVGNIAEGLMKL